MPNRSGGGLPIWNFYDKSADGSKTATCNYCRRQLSFKSTITNLKAHLKQKHISAYNLFLNCSKPETSTTRSENVVLHEENGGVGSNITTSGGGGDGGGSANSGCNIGGGKIFVSRTNNSDNSNINEPPRKVQRAMHAYLPKKLKSDEKNKMDISLLKMIVYDFQPFSIVNDVGFRQYTHALNPNYEIPDRKTLSGNLLPKIYQKKLEEIKTFVQIHAKSVCITVDAWTSRNLDSYMGITAIL